ncbi:NADP-dependent oxidoreductase [Streptomyces fradiae]|uniref:NADP-dependent oxidoreductase n=2 Tax=Streptomyces TaxID=1883 RepID=A0A3R7I2G4_9ACTN|nr:NADP-dependent oxidoreductase [Streptomyces fradiae]OFA58960.1 NADP-dependent oxidoreductase [Streptomyces fradiae]PQM22274.1 NADP-dependent oxidoreductase [Streptomyces xinghaiensis]RKM95527.1 NADP-dependent oxidoreductase [Streptomyces xinghaiensis]RNC73113.1 NADP-dependent oxidoreductase [Streptomyces xinghaiensis]
MRLAARPVGEVRPEDWEHATAPAEEPGEGRFAGRTRFISLDPAMRGWLDDRPSYLPPVGLGEVMRAGSVVEVTTSNHPDYRPGDHVVGTFGVQEHVVSDGKGALKIDVGLAPASTYLGALGMPGMTAYFGLLDVGALKEGETVVVSGAAGAVGSIVGQIAKVKGCRVVGIAGGAEKCALLTDELGFDAAIDYRAGDVKRALREQTPDGIDVYFDNVGGEILDAALTRLAMRARVVICGAISQYNNETPVSGPSNYLSLLVRRARMEGFVVFDYAKRYAEAAQEIAGWIGDGRLKVKEHVVKGTVDDFPETLQMLFRGENVGKLVLELS